MHKEKTVEDVYDDLITKGLYEEANLDIDEINKIKRIALEDYKFGKELKKLKEANWRVIFNIHYDVLRELCDQLIRFERQKISNHQGLFAFIVIHFPDLELDWNLFEKIRNMQNMNQYRGTDITKENFKEIEFQMDLYISTIKKEIERRIENGK